MFTIVYNYTNYNQASYKPLWEIIIIQFWISNWELKQFELIIAVIFIAINRLETLFSILIINHLAWVPFYSSVRSSKAIRTVLIQGILRNSFLCMTEKLKAHYEWLTIVSQCAYKSLNANGINDISTFHFKRKVTMIYSTPLNCTFWILQT